MRSKVLCVTTELSRHVGTTTLAQIQCHGAPLVRKKLKNQNFIKFLLLHPIARGSSLESSVARHLKSSFNSSPFSAYLLSRPSIHSASPALFRFTFFSFVHFCVLLFRWGRWMIVGLRVCVFWCGGINKSVRYQQSRPIWWKGARIVGRKMENVSVNRDRTSGNVCC